MVVEIGVAFRVDKLFVRFIQQPLHLVGAHPQPIQRLSQRVDEIMNYSPHPLSDLVLRRVLHHTCKPWHSYELNVRSTYSSALADRRLVNFGIDVDKARLLEQLLKGASDAK